jgi:hypothetical protein
MKTPTKTRSLFSAWTLILGLGSFVCSAQAVSVSPAAAASGNGAGVIRFSDQFAFFIVDSEHGLVSFHGTNLSFAQICSGVPFEFDPLRIQFINTPTGAIHALFSGAEHHVVIYPANGWPNPEHIGLGDCPALATLPVLASGTAHLIRTDNDITVAGRGADAFGWTAEGVLYGPTGGKLRYSETVRALVEPGGGDVRTLELDIRLVPIP